MAGISLDEATALALQANPDISVALSGREVESGQALQAGTRLNPTLSAQIEDLRSHNRITSLQICQQLETAGKRIKRIAAKRVLAGKASPVEETKAKMVGRV